ncbi:DUF3375 domain-containing protein [Ferruginibacter profundus]|nr:DUF3375 domain-containing protein [Bacteroidota bacterium]
MKKEELYEILITNPAVQILRLRNAHWVLPFLYSIYKEENRPTIEEGQLIQLLIETLIANEDGIEDVSEARIVFGDDEQTRSRKYILNWVQKRLLEDFQYADGAIHYQLSANMEKVFQWIQTLKIRKHVGTESRFKLLFKSLQDIVEHTEDDKKKRLELLKNKRAEIDKEIKAIELGIAPESYSDSQVQERLELFSRLSYELISDFREVEDNFKQIHRGIVEQHTKAEHSKGAIVGFAFEAYDTLRQSPQGKSFYAFWDFLISRIGNQHWAELTDQLLQLVREREISVDEYFLQNVKSMLLQQGKTVYDANDKMAEKLSRIITEKEITRHRRLRSQIAGIKELIFDLMDNENVDCGMQIDVNPDIRMVMERKLTLEQRKIPGTIKQPLAQKEIIADPERFSKLINTSFIDKKKLWQKVEFALNSKSTATLKEILELQPLENGIAEIVTYYSFIRDKKSRVQTIGSTTELIPLNIDNTKFVEVPYLLFSK